MRTFKKIEGVEVIELPTEWPVGPVNVFLLKGEKLTLVDCGRKMEKAWDMFNDALKELKLSVMDIEQIVLTHHHGDHVGLLDWILEENPIPVYAHENCRPFLKQDEDHFARARDFFSGFYDDFGVPKEIGQKFASTKGWNQGLRKKIEITATIDEGIPVPGLSEWQVIETKGHAQSHISLYRPKDQVLLCGDHLIKHTPAGIFLEAPIYPEVVRAKPLIQYVNNLRKCLQLPISLTLSGHGDAIDNTHDFIHEMLEKIDKRAERVKSKLQDGQKSGYEIIQEIYPDKYEKATNVLASDTVGLLDLLLEREEIITEIENGIIYYAINK